MSDQITKAFEALVDATQADVVVAFCKTGDRVQILCEHDRMDATAKLMAWFAQQFIDRDAKLKEVIQCN